MSAGDRPGGPGEGQTPQSAPGASRGRETAHEGQGLSERLDPEALDALLSLRATLGVNAFTPPEDPAAGEGQCAHGVLTSPLEVPLTSGYVVAPVERTGGTPGSADERQRVRTPDQPLYSTDPDQPRSDLLKRTRSSLASEVRRVRLECARTRIKLREAQARIEELEGAHHA